MKTEKVYITPSKLDLYITDLILVYCRKKFVSESSNKISLIFINVNLFITKIQIVYLSKRII